MIDATSVQVHFYLVYLVIIDKLVARKVYHRCYALMLF